MSPSFLHNNMKKKDTQQVMVKILNGKLMCYLNFFITIWGTKRCATGYGKNS